MKLVLVGLVAAVIGFGAGWAVFSWQPWEGSGASTHEAEIGLLKQVGGAYAQCSPHDYPTNVFDCSTDSGCTDNSYYVVRVVADGVVVAKGKGTRIPPIECVTK